jgi:hypothetical protein
LAGIVGDLGDEGVLGVAGHVRPIGVNEGAVVLGEETPGDRGLDLGSGHQAEGWDLISLAHRDQSPSPPLATMLIPPRLSHRDLELESNPVEVFQDRPLYRVEPIPLGLSPLLLDLPLDRQLDPPILYDLCK